MGSDASVQKIEKLINLMGGFYDAGAINVVRNDGKGGVEACKVTLAGDRCFIERLSDLPGESLVQVNVMDEKYKDKRPWVYDYAQDPLPDGYPEVLREESIK